ncbi:large subunit GTPase 1 [Ataeniobius toweri]|uniref:Large subunit GTPase 1 n=1 Tax=Ataeniobius toweri TaxID=208326 RepID=A0ABU7AA49_9TELE|nr:large subunit GTPase 1 [Ataeniobius toweri]
MGKKKAGGGAGLGRALMKERLQAGRGNKRGDSWLHTSELNDGYDWGRLNLQSVTEQSSMDDFLATAELAGTEFVAEKLNIKFVPAEARAGLLTAEEKSRLKKLHEENKHFLRIPRRPHWDESTTPTLLQQTENDSFLQWRRELAQLEEEQKLILTPFERNLEFWRQLWRVIERSATTSACFKHHSRENLSAGGNACGSSYSYSSSSAYPGPGRGGSRLSRDAQTSLSPDTSSRGSPRRSQASRET